MPNSGDAEHPLAEVFGFPINNFSEEAIRYRNTRLCPFHNKVPSCTKDKATAPLGVCSIYHNDDAVITCPVRFREKWFVTDRASQFFFPDGVSWTSIAEVNLNDKYGKTAGHIDMVLVSYDDSGRVLDFGALEIQAVYISGNIRAPFQHYMERPRERQSLSWKGQRNYPKPDYLSSSRKRLIPQVMYKGGILKAWGKKQAVSLQKSFFETLPEMPTVTPDRADIAWLVYDLKEDHATKTMTLADCETVYTEFGPALDRISKPVPGDIGEFMGLLQDKLDERLDNNPPDAPALGDIVLQ
jgi:hypothetical protein